MSRLNFTQRVLLAVQKKTQFQQSHFVERGFSANTISNWRRGMNEPSASNLKFFVECMGCNYISICQEIEQNEFKPL